MGRLILIAARNLRQHTRRTLLLGLSISAVTMLLVLLTSVSNGIQETMKRAATSLVTGHVNVGGFFKVSSLAVPYVTRFRPLQRLVKENTPRAERVVDRLFGWGKVVSPADSFYSAIRGVDVGNEDFGQVLSVVRGDLTRLREPRSILLFEKQAQKLKVSVGDDLTLSVRTIRATNNAIDVKVVAIAKDIGALSARTVFTPKSTIIDLYQINQESTAFIQIYLEEIDHSEAVAARLRRLIAGAGYRVMEPMGGTFIEKLRRVTEESWTGQKIDVTTWKDHVSTLTWIITAFKALTWMLIGILLIIIVIGVMNTLWISIRERTREIGTLRAIGMGRGGILWMFLLEAGILAVVATLLGSCLGLALATLLNSVGIRLSEGFAIFLMTDTLRLVVSPVSMVMACSIITVVMMLFALYPAYLATRLSPVSAIQKQ